MIWRRGAKRRRGGEFDGESEVALCAAVNFVDGDAGVGVRGVRQ
jgi:hypothetical protein